MGLFTIEIEARAMLADLERELKRVNEQAWWEQSMPKPGRFRAVRTAAGEWVMRIGARIAGLSVAPIWDVPEGARRMFPAGVVARSVGPGVAPDETSCCSGRGNRGNEGWAEGSARGRLESVGRGIERPPALQE